MEEKPSTTPGRVLTDQPPQPTEEFRGAPHLYLYGAATWPEVEGYLRSQTLVTDSEIDQILLEWREANKLFNLIVTREAGLSDTITTKPLSPEGEASVGAVFDGSLFKRTFRWLPIECKLVEIKKLIAAQRAINLTYVEQLKSALPSVPSESDLIEFCIGPRNRKQVIPSQMQVAENQIVYSSINTDLRFLGCFKKPLLESDLLSLA